ncbi:hypothetical protein BDK51DRAFT_36986 [Blyttiomyces helicus]|uniref:SH3 domain-containing protein n=1 Tax=Blyttiomyces helicus TaxID=388810 RepID=A0A4P9WNP9_9FUNG|nr:hypothetical protein BDK51DRAFT_36986 [Blyttiomyces helicus]|eukprot:RKO94761.1 hypothetical protein BDK51DRAFT_36986 [Blyttiomyces helicus]
MCLIPSSTSIVFLAHLKDHNARANCTSPVKGVQAAAQAQIPTRRAQSCPLGLATNGSGTCFADAGPLPSFLAHPPTIQSKMLFAATIASLVAAAAAYPGGAGTCFVDAGTIASAGGGAMGSETQLGFNATAGPWTAGSPVPVTISGTGTFNGLLLYAYQDACLRGCRVSYPHMAAAKELQLLGKSPVNDFEHLTSIPIPGADSANAAHLGTWEGFPSIFQTLDASVTAPVANCVANGQGATLSHNSPAAKNFPVHLNWTPPAGASGSVNFVAVVVAPSAGAHNFQIVTAVSAPAAAAPASASSSSSAPPQSLTPASTNSPSSSVPPQSSLPQSATSASATPSPLAVAPASSALPFAPLSTSSSAQPTLTSILSTSSTSTVGIAVSCIAGGILVAVLAMYLHRRGQRAFGTIPAPDPTFTMPHDAFVSPDPPAYGTLSPNLATPVEIVTAHRALPHENAKGTDGTRPMPSVTGGSSFVPGTMAVARAAHSPKSEDELALRIGDRVVVEEVLADGWAKGRIVEDGREGVFPYGVVVHTL